MLSVIMLNVIMLNVIMLNVIMLSVIMLNDVRRRYKETDAMFENAKLDQILNSQTNFF
jgi:hypothetical protein